MQPFDDRTPEEIDARNATIITFLGRIYEQSQVEDSEPVETDSISTPEQVQAVANVRQRLLQLAHDNQSLAAAREMSASKSINNRMPLPGQKTSSRRPLNVLALVAVMVVLIGSSIFVFRLARQQRLEPGSVPQTTATSSIKPSGQGNLLIGDMLQADPASRYLLQKQQFTQLNQSQMVDGYQVTLDRAYVDGNLLIMGVYAAMPYGPQADKGDQDFMTPYDNHVRLTTASGVQLPVLGFSNAHNVGDKQHLLRGLLLGFDAAGIQGNPAQVTFKLQMDVRCQALSWSSDYHCPRTVNFSLTLPFHASRRVVTPHQSVTMNGTTFTLERVVITPSEARFYIGGWSAALLAPSTAWKQTPQPESYDDTWYNVKLTVPGKTRDLCTLMDPTNCPQGGRTGASIPLHSTTRFEGDSEENAVYLNNDHTIFGFSLLEPFNEHGQATITIHKQLQHFVRNKDRNDGSYTGISRPVDDKNSSPWTIEFTLP